MEDTLPFTKYKFFMPNGSVTRSSTVFFADSKEEADQFIIFQNQKERVFQFTLSKLDYEWDEQDERFKKVNEVMLQSTIPQIK